MNFFINELATVNLFIIFVIIFAGFVFLKIMKRRLEY
jgi:hypothetical protein